MNSKINKTTNILCPNCAKTEDRENIPYLEYKGFNWICPSCHTEYDLNVFTGSLIEQEIEDRNDNSGKDDITYSDKGL